MVAVVNRGLGVKMVGCKKGGGGAPSLSRWLGAMVVGLVVLAVIVL